MTKTMKTSTHRLAKALLGQTEKPVRAVILGRFTSIWNGKKGDFTAPVPTAEIFPQAQ